MKPVAVFISLLQPKQQSSSRGSLAGIETQHVRMTYVITSRLQPRSLPQHPEQKIHPASDEEARAGIAGRGYLISRHFLLTEVSLLFAPPPTSRLYSTVEGDTNVGISDGFLEMHLKLSNHPSSILVLSALLILSPFQNNALVCRWTKAWLVLTFAACSAHDFPTVISCLRFPTRQRRIRLRECFRDISRLANERTTELFGRAGRGRGTVEDRPSAASKQTKVNKNNTK